MHYEVILQALWIIFPAYVANASALLVGGGTPIDFGKTWKDGRRILGNGKTWRGLFSGAFIGMTVGFGLSAAAKYIASTEYNFIHFEFLDFGGFPIMVPLVFSLCFGALCGDIIESFFKRRIGKKRGEDWFLLDQLDFILGAVGLGFCMSLLLEISGVLSYNWLLTRLFPWHILLLLLITPLIHILANFIFKKSIAHRPRVNKI